VQVDVSMRGPVPEKLARAEWVAVMERVVKGPLMPARVALIQEQNPWIERTARAEHEDVLAGTSDPGAHEAGPRTTPSEASVKSIRSSWPRTGPRRRTADSRLRSILRRLSTACV
jgi:hypothetical protein